MKEHPNVDPENIILLGHSEGCMLATAANALSTVNGMILLAGAAETLNDATKRQRDILFSELKNSKGIKGFLMGLLKIDKKGEEQAQKFIKKILETKTNTIKYNFTTINAKWHREHFMYNVIEDLKKVTCPVLAVTGSKDFQANPERLSDVPKFVKGESEIHVIDNMNHGLKEQLTPVSAVEFKKQYRENIDQPIHPDLQRILSNWLINHYKRGYGGT